MQIQPRQAATDSNRSLDFDHIAYSGGVANRGHVAVEISYREAVILPPVPAMIGGPYYEPFEILALDPAEIIAEKLRALCQRVRPTDLADAAEVVAVANPDIARVRECIPHKFASGIVRVGRHADRVRRNIEAMADDYASSMLARKRSGGRAGMGFGVLKMQDPIRVYWL